MIRVKKREVIGDFPEQELIIDCDSIILKQNEIEIKIKIEKIPNYETIKINGITYRRFDNYDH